MPPPWSPQWAELGRQPRARGPTTNGLRPPAGCCFSLDCLQRGGRFLWHKRCERRQAERGKRGSPLSPPPGRVSRRCLLDRPCTPRATQRAPRPPMACQGTAGRPSGPRGQRASGFSPSTPLSRCVRLALPCGLAVSWRTMNPRLESAQPPRRPATRLAGRCSYPWTMGRQPRRFLPC